MNQKIFLSFVLSLILTLIISHSESWAIYSADNTDPLRGQSAALGLLPGDENGQPDMKKPEYHKNRFIVKFNSSLTQSASYLMTNKRAFASALTDQSNSIDQLNTKYAVSSITNLFMSPSIVLITDAKFKEQLAWNPVVSTFAVRESRSADNVSDSDPDMTNIYLFYVPDNANIEEITAAYEKDPHVEYAQPDYIMQAQLVPNDPYYSSSGSWSQPYRDLWGLVNMHTASAWDKTQGAGVVVAVVDTGADATHPDLSANIWKNSKEIPDNNIDDDKNGFVDDVNGWNFAARNNSPRDGHGHGTHVSGTIAAVGNNTKGIVGVAYKSKIMPVKGLDDNGSGYSSDLALGIIYAAQNGADVINNSWGCSFCPSNPVVEDAVRKAYARGVVVVFAAGNSAENIKNISPQNMLEPIKVAATDHLDKRAYFSNNGFLLDVSAPGGGDKPDFNTVLSLQAQGTNVGSPWQVSPGYIRFAGTSMAAPHVSGLAALILSLHPDFTIEEVRSIIRNTSLDIGDIGFDILTGYGRADAGQAVVLKESPCVALIKNPLPGHTVFSFSNPIVIQGTASCRSFDHFTLEVGEGINPSTWTLVASGTTPVRNSILGRFNPASVTKNIFYNFRLTVFNSIGKSYRAYSPVLFMKNLHPGWPKDFGLFEGGSALVDLDKNGIQDIVLRSRIADLILALKHDGSSLSGWPIDWRARTGSTGYPSMPAIGDINGDNKLDVVAGDVFNKVYAFNDQGAVLSGWPRSAAGSDFFTSHYPMLVDFEGDGKDEVFIMMSTWNSASENGRVMAWRGDGSVLPGWPRILPYIPVNGIQQGFLSSGDVNGDGQLDIVAVYTTGQTMSTVCVVFNKNGNILPGWPKILSGKGLYSSLLALADLNNDGKVEIIFPTLALEDTSTGPVFHKDIYVFKGDGTAYPGWPINADSLFPDGFGVLTGPSIADLDLNGIPELLFVARAGDSNNPTKVAVYQTNGSVRSGWPVSISLDWALSPLVADVDADGYSDLIVAGLDKVFALDRNGKVMLGWPKNYEGYSSYGSVGDVDNDGKLELLLGGGLDAPLYLFDLDGHPSLNTMQWTMYGHDPKRSGLWKKPVNRSPVLPDIADRQATTGKLLQFKISATDQDNDVLYLSATLDNGQSLSTIGASLTSTGNGKATFSWTSGFSQVGVYKIVFKASDLRTTVSKTVNIFVGAVR